MDILEFRVLSALEVVDIPVSLLKNNLQNGFHDNYYVHLLDLFRSLAADVKISTEPLPIPISDSRIKDACALFLEDSASYPSQFIPDQRRLCADNRLPAQKLSDKLKFLLFDLLMQYFLLHPRFDDANYDDDAKMSLWAHFEGLPQLFNALGLFWNGREVLLQVISTIIGKKIELLRSVVEQETPILQPMLFWAESFLLPSFSLFFFPLSLWKDLRATVERSIQSNLGGVETSDIANRLPYLTCLRNGLSNRNKSANFKGSCAQMPNLELHESDLSACQYFSCVDPCACISTKLKIFLSFNSIIYTQLHQEVLNYYSAFLFDLVRDYPETKAVFEDIKKCDFVTVGKGRLMLERRLRESLQVRLIHSGVNTSVLITMYLSLVEALAIIDPTDSLQYNVLTDLKQHIRSRPDAIRCIVHSLTEDTESPLYKELFATAKIAMNSTQKDDGIYSEKMDDASNEVFVTYPSENACTVSLNKWVHSLTTPYLSSQAKLLKRYATKAENQLNDLHEWLIQSMEFIWSFEQPQTIPVSLLKTLGEPSTTFDQTTAQVSAYEFLRQGYLPLLRSERILATIFPDGYEMDKLQLLQSSFYNLSQMPHMWYPTVGEAASSRTNQISTIGPLFLSLLDLYGSPELFLTEYRSLVADRLLSMPIGDWNTDSEERVLELLKLRFGEDSLTRAEIQFRDTIDSRRAFHVIQEALRSKFRSRSYLSLSVLEMFDEFSPQAVKDALITPKPETPNEMEILSRYDAVDIAAEPWSVDMSQASLSSLVISQKYWPSGSIQRSKIHIHPSLTTIFDYLAAEYDAVRKPRCVSLLPSLGLVDIELDIEIPPRNSMNQSNVTVTTTVSGSPQQISLLLYFEGSSHVPLGVLAKRMHLSELDALRIVQFWVKYQINYEYDGEPQESNLLLIARETGRALEEAEIWIRIAKPSDTENEKAEALKDPNSHGLIDPLLDESLSDARATGADPEDALVVWRGYLVGMLSNLGPMGLERIHTTLSMFASMGDYPCKYIYQLISAMILLRI